MKDGFIKVSSGFFDVAVADIYANTEKIKNLIEKADKENINLLVLPELCITGYTCGDLFYSDTLISSAKQALCELAKYTLGKYPIVVVGLPLLFRSKLFNCAAALFNGSVLGIVPKTSLPNFGDAYEKRQFSSASDIDGNFEITLNNTKIPFGNKLVFSHNEIPDYSFGIEIGDTFSGVNRQCEELCLSGAVIIANPSASSEITGKADYRRSLVKSTSLRLLCGYVYSSPKGESTQDAVYSGHCIIGEKGTILKENPPFYDCELTISEIDVKRLAFERLKNTEFTLKYSALKIEFNQKPCDTAITRSFSKSPFIPDNKLSVNEKAETILQIQSNGLKKRLEYTHAKTAVIGISGGLDSTLALLVAARTMRLLNRPLSDISAITMPCFGTTKRTRSNSEKLCNLLGVTFREINIADSVSQHFKDIGQDKNCLDVTFENAQARERTQVLMDIANMENGLMVGTGDLSESALGWATYNGDHMSMYAVNCSVPKTLIRHIVRYEAEISEDGLKEVLSDILETPVSPELLPCDRKGEIAQKTEDIVGPYELHDFFLYHALKYGEGPKKIFHIAKSAFGEEYESKIILHWLTVFTRRFFSQQFKRSCLPDGPKVSSVSICPRGDLRMPSDAVSKIWLKEISEIKI